MAIVVEVGQGRAWGMGFRPAWVLAAVCALGPAAWGQMPRARTKVYFDTSYTADAHLWSADNHAKGGDYAEAIEIYQRVIQDYGDKVVAVPAGPGEVEEVSRLSVNARRECQRRIAALPPEARALYRTRVDPQAERWYRQGARTRDRSVLRRVVDQAFCSSWGDDALALLGDLAFQDGQFAEAMAAYSQLAPDRPGGQGMVHPDPSVDLAVVAAKRILCRAAIGEHPPTPSEVAAFAAAHPEAAGPFAGRTGPLGVALAEALRDDRLAPSAQSDGRWPTFAGAMSRNKVAPGSIDVGSLQWRVEMEAITVRSPGGYRGGRMQMGMAPASPVPPERLLGYHPIVVGDQVIVGGEKHITAYNLNSRPGENPGSPSGPVEVAWRTDDLMRGASTVTRGGSGLPRFTLTAHGDRVFARIGPAPATQMTNMRVGMGIGGVSPSFVVAVSRSRQGHQLWKREASDIALPRRQAGGGSRNAVFEGSPVADDRNVYVAITDRIEMTAAYVVCLDAETGSTNWVRYICEANASVDPMMGGHVEVGHRLLSLAGPTLYYQTNLGAVAAIDAETGGVRWLATYPWEGRGMGPGRERDLNPAIVHDGLVIVAPDDAREIYAFDAATGRLAWKSDPIPDEARLTHLLGVAKGHLIATGDRVLWFDARDGKLAHSWPDNAQAATGHGRGILAGDRVYWPTRTEIHVLDQATGLMVEPPIKLQEMHQCEGGNLVSGDGFLVVAQANSLVVFCQNSRLIDRYRDEIARAPDQAMNYYQLARAAEAIGRDDLALASLELARPRARPSETIDGVPLADSARDHQRRLLMKMGLKAKADGDWAGAAGRFEAAAGASRSDRDRLAARLELAEVQLARDEPRASVATLQSLLADERVRSLNVDAPDGHRSVRADLLIADRLATLLRDRGRDLYADFDRAAADLLARGKREKDPRLLEDVGRSYPAALAVPEAWLALGEVFDDLHRPGDAARAYKRFLAGAADDESRARALIGLARAYEEQKLWVSAREAYLQAMARFPDGPARGLGPAPVRDLVADRLGRAPFDRMAGDRSEPGVPVPLRRRWDRQWAESARPIGADGVPPSADAGRVFLASGREIRPVDPASGASAWTRDLGGEPIWVGYLADRIIAATRTRILALSLDKGAIEWQYDLGANAIGKAVAGPFARDKAVDPGGVDAASAPLQDFRIVGNRVYCLRGDRALMAFDGDSGLLDWSFSPAAGRINPRLLVGPRRIVLQARKPNAVLVLDSATGRRQAEFPQGEEEEWARDPLPIDDDHVALVADRMTIALFDTARGVNAWVFQETKDFPKYGAPRLYGDAERLLVLHDGHELIRLDPATGAKGWSRLLGTEDLSDRPEAVALAGDRVFVASGPMLSALAMADGSALWKRPLSGPSSRWAVALTERSVAAYPIPSRLKEDDLGTLPLVFHRRDDGEPVQRLLFQTPVSELTIRFSPRGALVATQGGLWALGDRQAMDGSKAPR